MRRALMLLVLATLAAASGCALLQPNGEASRQVHEIVGEAVSAARAAPEEQRRRLSKARSMYDAVPNESNGLRYAALLATLPAPWGNDEIAAAVLGPLAARRPETPLTQLAGMLAVHVAERQRLARELRAAERRAESALARAEAAERREESASERANTLQGQVEALKSIERSILQREEQRRNLKR
jgi:hypothetical protein